LKQTIETIPNKNLSRRNFLKIVSVGIGGLLLSTVAYAYVNNEVGHPVVDRVPIPIKNLKPSLEGFKIVQMADIHLYPYTQLETVEKAVVMANSLNPDLTVLVGDFVWTKAESIFALAPVLAKLNARYGVFAVLGNHDIWADVEIVKTGLREAGLPLLLNQGLAVESGKARLFLAGLDDGWSGYPDLEAALEGLSPGDPVVMLLHEPDLADRYSLDERISLQLAGHTHGGQVRIPGIGAVISPHLGHKYDQGLFRVREMWLYTNRGLGEISVPLRINCPPEITEIVLHG
jgi:predicted MPP superfamily phosphohydrolase